MCGQRCGQVRLLLAVITVLLAALGRAAATPITWSPATTISGDSDVTTDGLLIAAFNTGGPDIPTTTVNGVTFAALSLHGSTVTVGNFTFHSNASFLFNDHVGSTNPPFANLSAGYQAFLSSFAGGAPITLTIGGLTPGQAYEFEWWTNASSLGLSGLFTTATAGNSVKLNLNTTGQIGGVGQFAIGTFTADGPTEVIAFTGGPITFLDALELRAVPEPSSLSLIALGGAALVGWRWYRRQATRPWPSEVVPPGLVHRPGRDGAPSAYVRLPEERDAVDALTTPSTLSSLSRGLRLLPGQHSQQRLQFVRVHGLDEVPLEPDPCASPTGLVRAVGRDGDEADLRGHRVVPQGARHAIAVQPRQPDVAQYHFRRPFPGRAHAG